MSCRETVGEKIIVMAVGGGIAIVLGAFGVLILLGSQEIQLAEGSTVEVTPPKLLPKQSDRMQRLESEVEILKSNRDQERGIILVPTPSRGHESTIQREPKGNRDRRFEPPKVATPKSEPSKRRKDRLRLSDAQRSSLGNWF